MNTTLSSRPPRIAGVAGSIISVALVFGGSAAFAEGLTGFGAPAGELPGMFDSFSDSDIASLEQAIGAETTAVKIAEIDGAATPLVAGSRPRSAEAAVADSDLFPYSGRVLPLLVPRAEAVARAPATVRPGLTQPVGVPYSLLRPRTPAERSAR